MQKQRRDLRKQHNAVCRKILDNKDASLVVPLQAERKRLEIEIQRLEGGPIEPLQNNKSKNYIGRCPLCSYRIKYGDSYVESGKLVFCNDRHLKEYVSLIKNEK